MPCPRFRVSPERPRIPEMRSLIAFWIAHRAELASLLGQHVLLVAGSTLAAVAIACRSAFSPRAGHGWRRR